MLNELLDLSEQCGFSIQQQVALFDQIRPLFHNKPLVVAVNKIDQRTKGELTAAEVAFEFEDLPAAACVVVFDLSRDVDDCVDVIVERVSDRAKMEAFRTGVVEFRDRTHFYAVNQNDAHKETCLANPRAYANKTGEMTKWMDNAFQSKMKVPFYGKTPHEMGK